MTIPAFIQHFLSDTAIEGNLHKSQTLRITIIKPKTQAQNFNFNRGTIAC